MCVSVQFVTVVEATRLLSTQALLLRESIPPLVLLLLPLADLLPGIVKPPHHDLTLRDGAKLL